MGGGKCMKENFVFAFFLIILLIIIAVIIAMFISLAKQGDERRDMIVGKASTQTFAVVVVYVAFNVVKDIYQVLTGADLSHEGINPFVMLTTISLIYAIELIYHKKKYGD